MAIKIHPTSVIYGGAELGENVEVGPYCVIHSDVKIGSGTKLHSHVVIDGYTTIGTNNNIFPFVSLGSQPQDLKFAGEKTELIIGNNNLIREYTTMNPGTEGGGRITKIGNNCLFMMSTHVAHDCHVGNNVIMANNATLAGHVILEDYVIIGGLSAVHQFVRIGAHAMIGGMSAVEKDVVPFATIMGERAYLAGMNLVGLKRRNFSREEITLLKDAFDILFYPKDFSLNFEQRVDLVKSKFTDSDAVNNLLEFLQSETSRSFCMPKS